MPTDRLGLFLLSFFFDFLPHLLYVFFLYYGFLSPQISYSTLSVRNPRQLRCVPFHLLHAGEVDNFFRRCVIRFPFIETFVRAFGSQVGDFFVKIVRSFS